jgi:CRP-like cAMP-binding protein
MDLYNRLVKTIKYDHSKKSKDVLEFMDELPHKLKLELAMEIHKRMYSNVKFFDNKDKSFIAWVGTVIRPINIQETEYIFKECEEIHEIYFLVNGKAGYVLPRYNNAIYSEIEQGEHFGHLDIFGVRSMNDKLAANNSNKKKATLLRKFTTLARINCELLTLGVSELDKMRVEFPDVFEELYNDGKTKYKSKVKLKKKKIKELFQETNQPTKFAQLFMKVDAKSSESEESIKPDP